jgi:signal transduction histidine kinase
MVDQIHAAGFILDMAQIVAREDNETTINGLFLKRLLELSSTAEAASLWLYFPEQAQLAVSASRGYEAATLHQIRLAPGKSFGRTFSLGHPMLYATAREAAELIDEMDPGQLALYQMATGVGHPKSVITALLQVGETKLGVLVLENFRNVQQFNADDLKWLQSASNLIALALSNAHLARALSKAQTANEASSVRKDSVAFLAHEMRTPLTAIKGYATALLMDDVNFDAIAQREFLEQIDRECDTLIRLIEDLLESSVLDAGKLELDRQPVRLPRLVKEVVEEIRKMSPRHRFVVDFSSEPPLVEADPTRLGQVLRNLLENAVKYSPQGGLIVVRGETHSHQILISVADQGVGIAPEHLNRLFEKFFRVKSGASQATIGSGLGLPIARSIVQAHGGKIWAESRPGQGSTFYLTLPVTSPATATDADWDEPHE